jgi:hypothetical protein
MDVRPYGRFQANVTCSSCGRITCVPNYPIEASDPFSTSHPFDALNDYQKFRLARAWQRDNFGSRYRYGQWEQCQLRDTIQEWHRAGDSGLLISGSIGTGKTVATGLMMTCLAARNQFSFSWWNMSALLSFLSGWNDWGDNNGDDAIYTYIRECKYLFLDDLGVEYNVGRGMTRFNE